MSDGTIILYVAASVDGFIATEDGGVSWLEEFQEGTEGAGSYEDFFAGIDCLIMGSKTYEQVLAFGEWPYEQKPTYVVTSRDLPLANDAVELFDGEVGELTERLEQRYEQIWLVGGAKLAQTVLRLNQVDRLQLSLIPVLLGKGIRLFDDTGETNELSHIGTTTHEGGVVELKYDLEVR